MSRVDFLSLLTRAVKDDRLTEREASDLLRQFDAGELKVDDSDAPLDLSEAITPLTDGDVERAVATLLLLSTLSLLHLRRAHFREVLQDRFIEAAKGLAKQRAANVVSLSEWQQGMREQIRANIVQNVAVGSGSVPVADALTEAVTLQEAYLSRWADELMIKTLMGNPASELGMMARAAMYAGAGRAEGYKAEAELYPEGGAVAYIAVDDSGTCQSCLDAEGTYDLRDPFPVPPEICEGLSNCRCTLTFSEVAA